MRTAFPLLLALFCFPTAYGEIQTSTVEYTDGDVTLQGFAAWDPAKVTQPAPGILIVHQWMGLTEYEKTRCKQLADLGYVAFALDIYGQGVRPENPKQAAEFAGIYKKDRALYRRRLNLGLQKLRTHENVANDKIAAIGYCFGGTGVLELARSGADVKGVVSFHGGLDSPAPEDGNKIKCKILVCHGADDPFVPANDIDAFKSELNSARVDWQMIYYSNAVPAFTQPMAGNDNSRGAAYNEHADLRSWEAMKQFFDELFGN